MKQLVYLQLLLFASPAFEDCVLIYKEPIITKWFEEEINNDITNCDSCYYCSDVSLSFIQRNYNPKCCLLISGNITTVYSSLENDYPFGIDLAYTHTRFIEKDAFISIPYLIELNMRANHIAALTDDLFQHNIHLQIVDFSYNIIDTISNTTFSNNIKYINLKHNRLQKLDFHLPHSIINLELSFNMITFILNTSFLETPQLKTIKLNNNMLTAFSNLVFASMNNITDIDLSNNRIFIIDTDVIQFLNNIEYLHLQNNTLQLINFTLPSSLKYLDFSYNSISFIDSKVQFPVSLLNLNLSYNFISHIDSNTFHGLKSLNSLRLNNNLFQNLPIGCFHSLVNLQLLNLSNNTITLKYGIFGGLKSLTTLKIANNSIRVLPELMIGDLINLNSLDVSHNFLNTLDVTTITKHLKNLHSVYLYGNTFKCTDLMEMVAQFKSNGVQVEAGEQFFESNVYGIACSHNDGNQTNQTNNSKSLEEMKEILDEKCSNGSNIVQEINTNIEKDILLNRTQLKQLLKKLIATFEIIHSDVNVIKQNDFLKNYTNKALSTEENQSYSIFHTIIASGIFVILGLMLYFQRRKYRQSERRFNLTEMINMEN